MNVPSLPPPPTDNLYKFMALSGVVLLIVAPYFWAKFYITQAERTHLAIEALGSITPWDVSLFKAKSERGEIITGDQKKLVEKYKALQKESSRAVDEFLLYDRFTYIITGTAIFLGLLGVALTGFGFRLWYLRVQSRLTRFYSKKLERSMNAALNDSAAANPHRDE